jgi:hypothetical protein
MPFRVFVSHSTIDVRIIKQLKNSLKTKGIEAYIAELHPQAGKPITSKIKWGIESSHLVVALLTKYGSNSHWVSQEIGYAERAGKLIIPIIEEGVTPTGFMLGIEYFLLKKNNPIATIKKATDYIVDVLTGKDKNDPYYLLSIKCPECSDMFVYSEGCHHCYTCGYTKCV